MIELTIIVDQLMPFSSFDEMMNSSTGGNTSARTVPHTAPIKLNSKLRFGTSLAMRSVSKTIKVLKTNSVANGFRVVMLLDFVTKGIMI